MKRNRSAEQQRQARLQARQAMITTAQQITERIKLEAVGQVIAVGAVAVLQRDFGFSVEESTRFVELTTAWLKDEYPALVKARNTETVPGR